MDKRTTVRLPVALLKRAKRKAAAEGRTLAALIEEGLRHAVADPQKPSKKRRGRLPVSKVIGGLLPGIELTRLSDIQHMDDLEYVERMKHFK